MQFIERTVFVVGVAVPVTSVYYSTDPDDIIKNLGGASGLKALTKSA